MRRKSFRLKIGDAWSFSDSARQAGSFASTAARRISRLSVSDNLIREWGVLHRISSGGGLLVTGQCVLRVPILCLRALL